MIELIDLYFNFGLHYKDITALLASHHRYIISERHLKRILKCRSLFRRKGFTSPDLVISLISEQLQTSGQLHGYRWMYTKCKENRLHVRKEDVRLILKELDPRVLNSEELDVSIAESILHRGPITFGTWTHDKLKPFGICINGCIDGFSRKIIWMNAFTTSSDPKIVGAYYMEAVQKLSGCPRIARGDCGTENMANWNLVPVEHG